MDLTAKDPTTWRFGDVLGYDKEGNGKDAGYLRIMFIASSVNPNLFLSLNLVGSRDEYLSAITNRSHQWWVRIEKAGE